VIDDAIQLLVEAGYLDVLRAPQPGRHYAVYSLAVAEIPAFIAGLNDKKDQALNLINQRAVRRLLAYPHTESIKGTDGIHELRTRGGIRFNYFFDGAAVVVITHGSQHVNKRLVLKEGRRAEALRERYEEAKRDIKKRSKQ